MNIRELNAEQMDQLRWDYFYEVENNYSYYTEVSNNEIFNHYEGIHFVNDDFSCSMD